MEFALKSKYAYLLFIHVSSSLCSLAVPPFRTKELNQEVVDKLASDKLDNGTSQITDAWVMHKSETNRKKLGRIVKQILDTPDCVMDTEQFMILGGNHTHASNLKICKDNRNPPPNFGSLRCVIFPYMDEDEPDQLQIAQDVSSCVLVLCLCRKKENVH
jgi:hypothetical protein